MSAIERLKGQTMKITPQPLKFIGHVISHTVRDASGNSRGVVALQWIREGVFQVHAWRGTGSIVPLSDIHSFASEDAARRFARRVVAQLAHDVNITSS